MSGPRPINHPAVVPDAHRVKAQGQPRAQPRPTRRHPGRRRPACCLVGDTIAEAGLSAQPRSAKPPQAQGDVAPSHSNDMDYAVEEGWLCPDNASALSGHGLVAWRRVGMAFALWLRDYVRRMNCA